VIFGGIALVCTLLFIFAPKEDIAVSAFVSLIACIGTAAIGAVLGVLGIILSRGRSQYAYAGLLVCTFALTWPVLFFWKELWGSL